MHKCPKILIFKSKKANLNRRLRDTRRRHEYWRFTMQFQVEFYKSPVKYRFTVFVRNWEVKRVTFTFIGLLLEIMGEIHNYGGLLRQIKFICISFNYWRVSGLLKKVNNWLIERLIKLTTNLRAKSLSLCCINYG